MTVKELMEILKNQDPESEVVMWNCEYDDYDNIDYVNVDEAGVVLH